MLVYFILYTCAFVVKYLIPALNMPNAIFIRKFIITSRFSGNLKFQHRIFVFPPNRVFLKYFPTSVCFFHNPDIQNTLYLNLLMHTLSLVLHDNSQTESSQKSNLNNQKIFLDDIIQCDFWYHEVIQKCFHFHIHCHMALIYFIKMLCYYKMKLQKAIKYVNFWWRPEILRIHTRRFK